MPSALRLRDYSRREELRTDARRSKDVSQSRRPLSPGCEMEWTGRRRRRSAAWIRQTLRDWVHPLQRFGARMSLIATQPRTEGPKPRLSEEQLAQFAKIVEAGPDL